MPRRHTLCAILGTLLACADDPVRVELFDDEVHTFSWSESRLIRRIANETADEVRRYLPALPARLSVRVHPAQPSEVIESTGEAASASPPDTVLWIVDPARPGGVTAVAQAELRACLFHEFHHLVRDAAVPRKTMLDHAVSEGMATAFERDYAAARAPWGWYPADPEVKAWVEELRSVPGDADRRVWLSKHPDGRRWIGRRAGTYLVDRAVRATGKSLPELVTMPTESVLRLSANDAPYRSPK